MAFNTNDSDSQDLADINIVPLVDVMLVLLVIFMVTAPLSIGGIGVNLPKSKVKIGALDQKRVILSVDKKGSFYLDKLKIERKQLEAKLKAVFEFREPKSLYIRADRGVHYGAVVDAMSAAKVAGVAKISMLTKSQAK